MRFPRSSGVIVHPTSFPGSFGIGDFGSESRYFIDVLQDMKQTIWQVLPLSPVGYGNSPYASYSAFAGNAYLLSPDILHEKGLLTTAELHEAKLPLSTVVDFERVYDAKEKMLRTAAACFYSETDREMEERLELFKKNNGHWLNDYSLFMVLSAQNVRRPWNEWEKKLAARDTSTLAAARKKYKDEIRYHIWLQYEFHNQWMALKEYANNKGVRVIGDIPIFVDHNSADVWANPRYFAVDEYGNRRLVSGVPPDYFSSTGQLWGNPLYDWDEIKKDGYSWWIDRFHQMFHLFDAIRVDHFRGFESYWQVPAAEMTAENGTWVKGPGADLFKTIRRELGELPIIAEDLGFVTPAVEKLRDQFRFPGMKILHFAFDDDPRNSFLPHNYTPNSVVYTGTHDNDTTIGWYSNAPEQDRHCLREYTRSDGIEPNWELIRLAMLSVADQAIFPLQDYMNLDSEHRMNTPGTVGRNWEWRFTHEMLDHLDRDRIRALVQMSNRFNTVESH